MHSQKIRTFVLSQPVIEYIAPRTLQPKCKIASLSLSFLDKSAGVRESGRDVQSSFKLVLLKSNEPGLKAGQVGKVVLEKLSQAQKLCDEYQLECLLFVVWLSIKLASVFSSKCRVHGLVIKLDDLNSLNVNFNGCYF